MSPRPRGNRRGNGRINGVGRVGGDGRAHGNGRLNGGAGAKGSGADIGADAAVGKAYAEGVVDARLGRPALDILEATVVLEAWTGAPALSAMSTAPELICVDFRPPEAKAIIEPTEDREQQSVVAEGMTLMLSIISVAAWAVPLSRDYGPHVLANAIRLALPIAVALQWGLRSRYLGRRNGLAIFARDGVAFCALAVLALKLPLGLIHSAGPIAAAFVAIWVGGAIISRRGWGLLYASSLVAATVAFYRHAPADLVLGCLTAFTLVVCLLAVYTSRKDSAERAGSLPRALLAALLGGCIGALLIADPTLGWGVRGLHPAISLLPSVIGSMWGGYYLWNLYDVIPRGLSGTPLAKASKAAVRGPAMSIFFGSMLRLLGTTIVLSGLVLLIGRWTRGADAPSLFVAFGGVALLSMLIGLLESLSLRRAALLAAVGAVAAEIAWHRFAGPYGLHWHISGAALVVGVSVGVLLALPPLIARLVRSGNVLATTLWIQ